MNTKKNMYICFDCGHTQDEMVSCAHCGAWRTFSLSLLLRMIGEHHKALLLLGQAEDIISGLEADNAGIDLWEARQWWLSVENFFLDIKGEND